MSVSEKQTVEIIKVLYRGANILILDEPTAVLTPQETQSFFAVLRRMKDDGKAIIIITHKLHEVLDISDRVSVLPQGRIYRNGRYTQDKRSRAYRNDGGQKDRPQHRKKRTQRSSKAHRNQSHKLHEPRRNSSFERCFLYANSGEILGIAGIVGSGQRELLEAIAGLQHIDSGKIIYNDPKTGKVENLRDKTPLQIRNLGVRLSFVPEDRLGMGLVGNMDIVDNMMLRSYNKGEIDVSFEKVAQKTLPTTLSNSLRW